MPSPSFEETVARLVGQDPRYAPDAYRFVRDALDFTARSAKKPAQGPGRHISGAELLEGTRRFALREYGAMAKTVLDAWGIRRCADIGQLVFHLVEQRLLSKTDQDSLHDFDGGYEFEAAFRAPFRPDPRRTPSRLRQPE